MIDFRGWRQYCYAMTFIAPVAIAGDDFFNAGLSYKRIRDDNFFRDPEKVSEEIGVAAAGIVLNKTIQSQKLQAQWQATDYRYQQHEDFDATIQQGQFIWTGQWGDRIKTDIEWLREARPVDRLEFIERDIINRDDATAKIGYGTGDRLTVFIGGRKSHQNHSNESRDSLDFSETEASLEIDYKTAGQSTLAGRLKNGERLYPNHPLNVQFRDLDFNYQQAEVEGNLELSPKTNLSLLLASFVRDGVINDGKGTLASLEAAWLPDEKLKFETGYAYKEPAIGEISDSPYETQRAFFAATWQFTSKVSFASKVSGERQKYNNQSAGLEREEKLYAASPLVITFNYTENFSIRVEAERSKRESPLEYRNYLATLISGNIVYRY